MGVVEESPVGLHVFERGAGRVLFETPVKAMRVGGEEEVVEARGKGQLVAESPLPGKQGGGEEESIYDALGWNDDDDFM